MQLRIRDLAVDFSAPEGGILPALGPLSFDVEDRQFVCILGPSGCGKSTLIRVVAGLQKATEGSIWAGNTAITDPLPDIAIMFQNANLMPWRTVRDNIALPLELAGVAPTQRYQVVQSLLPQLNLEGFEMAYPGELSGGMEQRVALGRVIVQDPQVLLLDEPFGALDALTREKISIDLLRVWQQSKQTVLMVTHDINESVLLADRIIVLSKRPGMIVADIEVNLPRPRIMDIVYSDAFTRLARRVRDAIDTA
jgi:NitT/TauT family transport system ATP-binding protein